ncbi:MAG TPA: hypothetical protein DEB74_16845 [Lachnospiraceae bacterium]|nr:hypothetical protein [Lachnospiraceae bacterium]
MKIINLSSIANPISISVQNPSRSDYDRFIGLEHYDSGEPVITRFQGTELLTTSAKAFKANDILIARRNVYLKRAGIVFFDGITSGDSIILRLKEDTQKTIGYSREDLIRYIPFMLNSEHFWIYANKHADGMNSKRISKDTLLEYEFELPSIDEMRDISDKLWAAYRLKEAYKKLLVTTDEMVKSQFIEMFFDNKYQYGMLRNHVDIIRGVSYKPADVQDKQDEDSYAILRSNNIQDGEVIWDDLVYVDDCRISDMQALSQYDIVICASNGSKQLVGKAAMLKEKCCRVSFGAFCLGVKCKDSLMPEYLSTYMNTSIYRQKIEDLGAGSNIINIKPSHIQNLEMPIPPIEAQQGFATILRQADKSKFELRKSIDAIDKVIKSLINN